MCVCACAHCGIQLHKSLQSRVSSLVACAQSIPKSHYAANACERERRRKRAAGKLLGGSLTLPPAVPLLLPLSLPLLLLHFTFYVRQHQQVTKCIACQMVYVSGDGATTHHPPAPLAHPLPIVFSFFIFSCHTQHSWHSLLYGAAALSTFARQVLLSCSGDFVVALVAASAAASRLCHRNLITNIVATVKINNRFQEALLLLFPRSPSLGCLGI